MTYGEVEFSLSCSPVELVLGSMVENNAHVDNGQKWAIAFAVINGINHLALFKLSNELKGPCNR